MALLWTPSHEPGFPYNLIHCTHPTDAYSPFQHTSTTSSSSNDSELFHISSTQAQPCSTFCFSPSRGCALRSTNSSTNALESSLEHPEGDDSRHVSLPHSRHVFLCYKQPHEWPSSPFSFDWGAMPRALRAAVLSTEATAPRKPLMTVCEGKDDCEAGRYNGDVLLFPDMLLFRALTRFDIECFIDEALLQPDCQPGKSRLKSEPLTGCHVFVCCQSTAGAKCGSTGERVAARLKAELTKRGVSEDKARVWRCCHLANGLAQCRGNVVIFGSIVPSPKESNETGARRCTEGEWYSGVTPADVADLVDSHILGDNVVERLWVGSMDTGRGLGRRGTQLPLSLDLAKPGTPMKGNFLSDPAMIGEVMDRSNCAQQQSQFDCEMVGGHWGDPQTMNEWSRHGPHTSIGPGTQSLHPVESSTLLEPLRSTHSCPEENPAAPFLGQRDRHVSQGGNSQGMSSPGQCQQNGGSSSFKNRHNSPWGSPSALTRANLSGNATSHATSPLVEASECLPHLGGGQVEVRDEGDTCKVSLDEVSSEERLRWGEGRAEDCQSVGKEKGSRGDAQVGESLISADEKGVLPRQGKSKGQGRKKQGMGGKSTLSAYWWGREGSVGKDLLGCPLVASVGCTVAVAAGVCVFMAVLRSKGGSQQS